MQSKEYWEQRALQREDENYKNTEKTLQRIRLIYSDSSKRLIKMADKILFNFMKVSGVNSKDEASKILSMVETAEVMAQIRNEYEKTGNLDALAKLNAPSYSFRLSRLQAIQKAIEAETTSLAEAAEKAGIDQLTKSYADAYYKTIYDVSQLSGQDVTFSPLSHQIITEAIANRWYGKNYSERVWKNTDLLAKEAGKIIDSGLTAGASVQQMTYDILDWFDVGAYVAERLVRTEINRIHNNGSLQAYLDSEIKKYDFLATLDADTCSVCGALDGKTFLISEAKTGVNLPPIHSNDRCTIVAHIDGIDQSKDSGQRIARDPKTGKNYMVNGNMTYTDWRKSIDQKYGTNALDTARKQLYHQQADKDQFEKMRKVLGNDMTSDIAKFRDIKYNKPDEWQLTKYNYRLRNRALLHPETILKNAGQLHIDERKYTGYLFNPENTDGCPKGQAITSRLGYNMGNYTALDKMIKTKITKYPAILKGKNKYGEKYEVNMVLRGLTGRQAKFKVGVILDDSGVPRLTTAFIDKLKGVD